MLLRMVIWSRGKSIQYNLDWFDVFRCILSREKTYKTGAMMFNDSVAPDIMIDQ